MLLSIFVGLLATEGLAAKKGEPAVTHISFADSAKNHLVNIRAQISDSVLVTNLASDSNLTEKETQELMRLIDKMGKE